MRRFFILIAFLLAAPGFAGSLVNEAPQEDRIRQLAAQLRCPVCQSENILDSHSGTAREMLDLVREQAAAGQTDTQILAFFQSRYGDYVLLSPPTTGSAGLIWWVPILLIVGGGAVGLTLIQRLKARPTAVMQSGGQLTEARLEDLEP